MKKLYALKLAYKFCLSFDFILINSKNYKYYMKTHDL